MDVAYRTEELTLHVSGLQAVIQEPDSNAASAMYVQNKSRVRALMDFWARCTVRLGDIEKPEPKDIMKLLEPDYLQLGLNIYCLATGKKTLKLAGACACCGKPNGAEIDLTPWLNPEVPDYVQGPDPTWEMITPRLSQNVVFGYTTGEQDIAALERDQIDLAYNDWIAIRSIDGASKVRVREVAAWPLPDHDALVEAIRAKKEWYETRIGLRHSCGFWEEVNFMQDPRFVMLGLVV